jgi:hypothetical protein
MLISSTLEVIGIDFLSIELISFFDLFGNLVGCGQL